MTGLPLPRFHALVPCAGTGSRSGTALPKQYQPVAGQPMVLHTLQALAQVPQIDQGWVVVAPKDTQMAMLVEGWPARFVRLACGGQSRAQSVFNGLSAMMAKGTAAHDWVLVHDAARCLITPQAVSNLIKACKDDPVGGLLALPLPDTLKAQSLGAQGPRVAGTVTREDKWLAQTPQMFRLDALAQALEQPSEDITDEASAMEAKGHTPLLVEGASFNFKVTYPQDWALAEAVLNDRQHRPGVLS